MKSPLAGQLLPRDSQAAVFCSFAMSERYASTPGQLWLVWAEVPARLPSSPAKHSVCRVNPPWLPSIFRDLEVSLDVPRQRIWHTRSPTRTGVQLGRRDF